jgi:hypothetical protein
MEKPRGCKPSNESFFCAPVSTKTFSHGRLTRSDLYAKCRNRFAVLIMVLQSDAYAALNVQAN